MYLPISLVLVTSVSFIEANAGGRYPAQVAGRPWDGAQPHEPPPLPSGWSEHVDPSSGQPYYFNSNDGTTTWERPGPLNMPPPEDENPEGESQPTSETAADQLQVEDASEAPLESEESKPEIQVESHDSPPDEVVASSNNDLTDTRPQHEEQVRREEAWREPRGWNIPPSSEAGVDPRSRAETWAGNDQQTNHQPQHPGWHLNNGRETSSSGWNHNGASAPAESTSASPHHPEWNQQGDPEHPDSIPGNQTAQTQEPPVAVADQMRQGENSRQPWGQAPSREQSQPPPTRTGFFGGRQRQQLPPPGEMQRQPDPSRPLPHDGAQRIPETQSQITPQQQQQSPHNIPQERSAPENFRVPGGQPKIPETLPHNQRPPNQRPPLNQQQHRPQRPPQYGRYPQGNYPPQYGQPPPQDPRFAHGGGGYNGQGQYRQPYHQAYQVAGNGQLVDQAQPGLRDSLGRTWNNLLGFGNRTKEALAVARDTVTTEASEAARNVATTSSGIWGQARSAISSVFESKEKSDTYSMSGSYNSQQGNPQGGPYIPPQGAAQGVRPPPGYGQQPPRGYGQQPSPGYGQQPPPGYFPNQGYPPQNPGRPGSPPWPPRGPGQLPPQGDNQQQYPRYPPGFRPPVPRTDVPDPQQQQASRQVPPQAQWGNNGQPPSDTNGQLPPPGYPGAHPGPPPQRPQQDNSRQESELQQPDPWQHPGLSDGY